MIFRQDKHKQLHRIHMLAAQELQFLEAQTGGKIKYIHVATHDLPRCDSAETVRSLLYKLSKANKIIIDPERTLTLQLSALRQQLELTIYDAYPQSKQNSDIADKMYYESQIKAGGGYPNLEKSITAAVIQFYAAQAADTGASPAQLAAGIAQSDDDQTSLEQLIKAGIRVTWVQDCKAAYRVAVANLAQQTAANLSLPVYPLP